MDNPAQRKQGKFVISSCAIKKRRKKEGFILNAETLANCAIYLILFSPESKHTISVCISLQDL